MSFFGITNLSFYKHWFRRVCQIPKSLHVTNVLNKIYCYNCRHQGWLVSSIFNTCHMSVAAISNKKKIVINFFLISVKANFWTWRDTSGRNFKFELIREISCQFLHPSGSRASGLGKFTQKILKIQLQV
jgi:hypothetical protein